MRGAQKKTVLGPVQEWGCSRVSQVGRVRWNGAPAGWFMKDWNLDADALAAAPDILLCKVNAWGTERCYDMLSSPTLTGLGLYDGVYIMYVRNACLSWMGIETGALKPGSSVTLFKSCHAPRRRTNSLPAQEYGKYISVQAKHEYIRDHRRDQSIVAYHIKHIMTHQLIYRTLNIARWY